MSRRDFLGKLCALAAAGLAVPESVKAATTYAVMIPLTGIKSAPQWGSIDLGSPVAISEIRMLCENYSGGLSRAPNTFVAQGSTDGVNWVDVQSFSGVNTWQATVWLKFNLIDGSYA